MVRKGVVNIDLIKNYIKENNISKNKFCKLCKISPSTLKLILAEEDTFYLTALWKISLFLNVKFWQMFK